VNLHHIFGAYKTIFLTPFHQSFSFKNSGNPEKVAKRKNMKEHGIRVQCSLLLL
jgi:hypothetical protein